MPKRDFQASKGLVKKVARKQSGVIEKAWLEAVMNSVDAGADLIELRIEETWSDISDDGESMASDEIKTYFEQFGLEDEDIEDKEFGKFRIGRGQIFNFGLNVWRAKENYMVVSLDDKQVTVNLEDCTAQDDESIIEANDDIYVVDTEGLGYALLDAEEIDEGLTVHVEHYEPLEDVGDKIETLKELVKYVSWVHEVTISINGEKIEKEPEVLAETDNAWFVVEDDIYSNRSPVYNKGAKVDTFSLGPKRIGIISKHDLDVTLDRTDILDTDEYWKTIQQEYNDVATEAIIEEDDSSKKEINWLLRQASSNISIAQRIMDEPMIEDVDGDLRTIEGIAHSKIGFASKQDTVAEEANDRAGVVMVDENYEDSLTEFIKGTQETIDDANMKSYSEIVDEKLTFEMEEVEESKLSKKRSTNLMIVRSALLDLGFTQDVKPGYSNHRNVWKNEEGDLYIHKDLLNKKKRAICTEVLFKVAKVAAHDGDSRAGLEEGYSFNRNFYRLFNGDNFSADHNFPEVQQKMFNSEYK